MKKILLSGFVSGLAMSVVGMILSVFLGKLLPSVATEYMTPLFRPWSDPLMSLIFVVPFITGFFLAFIWQIHKVMLRKNWFKFATALSILGVLGMLMTYSCFPMSFLMLVTWCVSMILQYFVGVWILSKMSK